MCPFSAAYQFDFHPQLFISANTVPCAFFHMSTVAPLTNLTNYSPVLFRKAEVAIALLGVSSPEWRGQTWPMAEPPGK